jgi:hypothetical protein
MRERAKAGFDGARDFVAGIDFAHVGLDVGHHQPPARRLGRHPVEAERHRRARPQQGLDRDGAADVPQQEVLIQVCLAEPGRWAPRSAPGGLGAEVCDGAQDQVDVEWCSSDG